MRIAILGNQGMLGQELDKTARQVGFDVVSFNRKNFKVAWDVEYLSRKFESFDAIINCIAYTAVDKAEVEEEIAKAINGIFPGKLGIATKNIGNRLIHFSTDYVFDGLSEEPYKVSSEVAPKTAYGRTKALGEQLIFESNSNFSILRTAWLYGEHGPCFPKTIADRLQKNGSVKVVNDQIGQPTWAHDVAELALDELRNWSKQPIVHAVSSGEASWFEFAQEIASTLGYPFEASVIPVTSKEFSGVAKRPDFSVLDNAREIGPIIGNWLQRWTLAASRVLPRD